MNIGLVGLGSMGLNLAKNIISKKYTVYAYEKNEVLINALRNDHIQNLILNDSWKLCYQIYLHQELSCLVCQLIKLMIV